MVPLFRLNNLKCPPRLTGCGTQHPLRALGGTCVCLAGRCPNNSSLFPPLAAVVVVAGHLQRKIHFYFRVCRGLRAAPNTFSQVGSLRQTAFCCCQPSAAARQKEHELPRTARRASDLKSAEHKKSFSAATWIFCMEPNSFGVTRGVQPLVRASRASKVAGALFWFSFGTQKRTCPAENHCIKAIPPIPRENALHGNITANSSAPLSPPRGSAHRWRAGCARGSGAGRPVPACLPGPPTRWSGSSSA